MLTKQSMPLIISNALLPLFSQTFRENGERLQAQDGGSVRGSPPAAQAEHPGHDMWEHGRGQHRATAGHHVPADEAAAGHEQPGERTA